MNITEERKFYQCKKHGTTTAIIIGYPILDINKYCLHCYHEMTAKHIRDNCEIVTELEESE